MMKLYQKQFHLQKKKKPKYLTKNKVNLYFNGTEEINRTKAFDPFYKNNSETIKLENSEISSVEESIKSIKTSREWLHKQKIDDILDDLQTYNQFYIVSLHQESHQLLYYPFLKIQQI